MLSKIGVAILLGVSLLSGVSFGVSSRAAKASFGETVQEANRRSTPQRSCQQYTYCRGGYAIWCYEEGDYCDSDVGYGSWVWCAASNDWGQYWESSDFCY